MATKLAVHGGEPVRASFLPYARQWVDEEDVQAVAAVLRSDYLTTGPAIDRFEREIAAYVGARYAVAFSSGTAALHAACFAAGIGRQDEVITSPLTFAASANCILYQGGNPVFADIDPQTYNICPKSIEASISHNTKALIPVDYAGMPVNIDSIRSIAREHNLVVIEDAAHALGATYKGKKIGSLSDMTMFSFHPVKHITTGEGGLIATDNEEYWQKLLQFRTHGITRDAAKLKGSRDHWYYEMQFLGYNYRLTDIQAALGLSQLKRLSEFIVRRREYAGMYTSAFRNLEGVLCPSETPISSSSWHLYVLRLQTEKIKAGRREIFAALRRENIGVNVHYIPVYLHPYYQQLGYKKGLCPRAEAVYEEVISLPLFPAMTRQDVSDVIAAVNKVISHYRR